MEKVIKINISRPYGGGSMPNYSPEFCAALVDHMANGRSFDTFAAKVDVSKTTIYRWKEKYEEFKQAAEIGEMKRKHYWENLGMAAMFGKIPSFNAKLFMFFVNATKQKFHNAEHNEPKLEYKALLDTLKLENQ